MRFILEIKKLKKTIKKDILVSNQVYIIGHNYIDLDAYGAMVGISKIVEKFNKKYTFIINDDEIELSVNNAINKLNNKKYMEKEVKSFNKSLLTDLQVTEKTYYRSLERLRAKIKKYACNLPSTERYTQLIKEFLK